MLPLWIVLAILPILGGAERFNCRGRILGAYYADAKSGCKAFHVCVRVAGGGIRDFRFFCPPGTLFHQEAQTCTDWGDDDPLACPADLYDGQFDLYRIGSGFDTKKPSSEKSRDEESEFGLQRAETGDRRLSHNSGKESSDLRAAHSSDFFSGQRERGRDDSPAPAPSSRSPHSRQSFRRATSPKVTPSSTQYTTPSTPPQPSSAPQYETKRKLVRKRPIYASTVAPTTFAQNTPQQPLPPKENYPQQPFPQKSQQNLPKKQQNEVPPQQTPFQQKPQINVNIQRPQQQQSLQHNQHNNIPSAFVPPQQSFKQQQQPQVINQRSQQSPNQQPDQRQPNFGTQQQNFNRGPSQTTLTPPDVNLPPQYKDEYVEVSRVAPKKPKNRYFPSNPTPASFAQSSPTQNVNKKDGLVELYNYDSQSTPVINTQNENRPLKIRNNFNVQDVLKEDFARTNLNLNNGRNAPSTTEYNTAATRDFANTPANKNFNSVSYEPEKNNFVSFSGAKQNYFNNPTTTPTTTIYTTPANFNTIAYNTNIALNTIQPANYNSEEDDGQYRPPEGEDDGQYRPELYERELLSGAHSLNIAASGNRLPEDQKTYAKSQVYQKPVSQTAAPRPFRPAPTPTNAPTSRAPEPTTTYRAPTTTVNTQRSFDYFQTYTTTSRPSNAPAPGQVNFAAVNNNAPARVQPSSTSAPRTPEPRPVTRAPAPPTVAPTRPSTRPPHYAKSPKKQEDSSYDYAYYDSDPGFSEYDQIEEFGRTKSRA